MRLENRGVSLPAAMNSCSFLDQNTNDQHAEKMKLDADIDDISHHLDVHVDGDKVLAKVDDREYELEASQVEPGVYLVKNNGRVYQISVSETSGAQEVIVRNSRFVVSVI